MRRVFKKQFGPQVLNEGELNQAIYELTVQLMYLWISALVDFVDNGGEINHETIDTSMWPDDPMIQSSIDLFFSLPIPLSEVEMRTIWKRIKEMNLPPGKLLLREAETILMLAGFRVLYLVKKPT